MNVPVGGEGEPKYWVHIFGPKSNMSFPTIFFVSGIAANVPVGLYSDLLTRIANKGYVIVALDLPGNVPNYPKRARDLSDVMVWAKEGKLQTEMIKRKLAPIADLQRTTVMAQSAGNHIVGQAMTDSCMYAKAMVMIDPVDGLDPFGIVTSENLITPGKKVNFSIPALLMDNGLDPKGTRLFKSIPCMPIKLGSPRWYNAWRGPIWHVNATAYGHVDCLDDSWVRTAGLLCPSNSKTDKPAYREHLAATAHLFIQAIFDNKPENLLLLENKSHFAVDVVLEHDRKGLTKFRPGCTSVPDYSEYTLV